MLLKEILSGLSNTGIDFRVVVEQIPAKKLRPFKIKSSTMILNKLIAFKVIKSALYEE